MKATVLIQRLEQIARNLDECNDTAFAEDVRQGVNMLQRYLALADELERRAAGMLPAPQRAFRECAKRLREIAEGSDGS